MKYIPGDSQALPTLELTRRNLTSLLEKLDDPDSQRTLVDGEHKIAVVAVEDDAHYKTRAPGPVLTKGVLK